MPPELLTTGHLSKAADSFAWGAILWELFSGERPWPGMLPMQVRRGPLESIATRQNPGSCCAVKAHIHCQVQDCTEKR